MTKIENLISLLQNQNQQLQLLEIQKHTLSVQTKETEKALETLETSQDIVYKSVGPILVKTTKEVMKKELEESKEDLDIKLKAVESQEKRLQEKIKKTQEEIQAEAGQAEKQTGTGG